MFSHVEKVNRTIIWLNLLLLLSVGFMPFSTALLGRYPLQQITVVIYGINALVISLLFNALWFYAASRHLIHKEPDPNFIEKTVTINSVGPMLYVIAIFASYLSIYVSIALFGLVPLLYIAFGKRYIH